MDDVIDHTPFATVAVPILFDPSYSVIVCPLTPVPVTVGVASFVGVDIVFMIGAEGPAAITKVVTELVTISAVPAPSVYSARTIYL